MYNAAALKSSFAGLVGISQAYDPEYQSIRSFLTESASGLYIETVHPLCSIDTLLNAAPEFKQYEYPNWTNRQYQKGNIVSNGGKQWRANKTIAAGQQQNPQTGSIVVNEYGNTYDAARGWDEYDPFAEWINDRYKSAVLEMINDLIRYKRLEHSNRTLIDSLQLFDGIGAYIDRIIKRGRFVGLELQIASQQGLTIAIDKIGLQLDAAQDLDLYLFHSSAAQALQIITINYDKAGTFTFKSPVDAVLLNYFDDTHDTNGVFYLGYYEDDLVGQAIHRTSSWGTAPCQGCTGWNFESWQKWSKHTAIRGFSVPAASLDADKENLFNAGAVAYDDQTNWGMNLALTVACDLSPFFITNRMRMADLLAMKVCMKFLNEIGFTTRINVIADKTRSLAIADLSETDEDSLASKYKKEIQALALEFSGMSRDCMPCATPGRIKHGAI